jgi:hypothetical protein
MYVCVRVRVCVRACVCVRAWYIYICKVTPWHACAGTEGWRRYCSIPFANSVLEGGGGWSAPRSGHFTPWKARYLLYRVGLRAGLDGHGKSRPLWVSIPRPSRHAWSLSSSVDIATVLTGWTVRGSNPSVGDICRAHPDRLCGPPSYLFMYRGFFPAVKWPGREVNHSSPSVAEVKNEWIHTSTVPICLHGLDREKFTFLSTWVVSRELKHWETLV